MVVMGPGRRNITAGGLGTRLPPAQHALASVSDTSLVLLSALLPPPQIRRVFCALAAAQRQIRPRHLVRDWQITPWGGLIVPKPGTPRRIVPSPPTPLAQASPWPSRDPAANSTRATDLGGDTM